MTEDFQITVLGQLKAIFEELVVQRGQFSEVMTQFDRIECLMESLARESAVRKR